MVCVVPVQPTVLKFSTITQALQIRFFWLKCYKVRACEIQKSRFNKCGFLKCCWKVKMSQF